MQTNWILYKSIADSSEQTRLLYDARMKRCNRLFDDISTRLAQYLRIETEGKEIDKIDSIAQEITNDTQVISFNYTNTIKLYTDKCYYVHGSIDEDKGNIVLGFPQNNIPDFVSAAGRMSGQPVQRSRRICFSQRACALLH